jgi:nicotinate phosphoribosyltransferase
MLNFPTLIATNSSRFKTLGNGRKIMEFGLRRAQGPNGSLMGTLYSYIGGIDATSNVLAGQRFGVPVVGTMGHSYVTSLSSLDDLANVSLP